MRLAGSSQGSGSLPAGLHWEAERNGPAEPVALPSPAETLPLGWTNPAARLTHFAGLQEDAGLQGAGRARQRAARTREQRERLHSCADKLHT